MQTPEDSSASCLASPSAPRPPTSATPGGTRSLPDALRHAVETGDALRPAAWGPGFYLIVSPRALDGSIDASLARLRNPVTAAPADLDVEDMLGPWVTLSIRDAQIESATRAADGEEAS